MKFNFFKSLLLSSFVVLLSSCLDTTTDVTVVSTNPCFVSLTFAANDSIPNIENAVFTLEYDALLNDSIIVNLDSLPFNTRIDSVNPTFTFYSSAGARLIFENDKDSITISGTDTIDFGQSVKVRNYASDGVTSKPYRIKVNVHQVNPELYVWGKLRVNSSTLNVISQKAIILNNNILYYLNDGSSNYLYTITNDSTWGQPTIITNLPNKTSFSDLTLFKGSLYLTQNTDVLYSSSNGISWATKTIPDYNFKSLLFSLNDKLWAIAQLKSDLSKYYFANSIDGITWLVNTSDVIPTGFPTSDFSAISFSARTGKPKAIVIGGKNSNDKMGSWSTENGTYWVPFSNENHTLDTLAVGSSIISYDNKLLLFGIRTDGISNHFKQSIDEGLSWQTPDTTYNKLPKTYTNRSYQSVVVLNPSTYLLSTPLEEKIKSNWIFIIGGKNAAGVLSDIWTGKINRKKFMIQ